MNDETLLLSFFVLKRYVFVFDSLLSWFFTFGNESPEGLSFETTPPARVNYILLFKLSIFFD